MKTSEKVTVIMRTKNSENIVAQALAGLHSQSYKNFSLLVVDSGSTDNTLNIVRKYPCRIIQIEPGNYVPGLVLNKAIAETNSEIIVFQNSDVVQLNESALSNLISAFDSPNTAGAYSRQIPRPEAETWVRRDYAVSFPKSLPAPPWITLSLPFAAIRRKFWEEHQFYSDAWGSEDTEWGHWAISSGYSIKYVPDSLVMHSHNYTLKQLYGRRFIEGEADAFIFRRDENWYGTAIKYLKSSLRDMMNHLIERDYYGLLFIPAVRFVYSLAYLKGHSFGVSRIRNNDRNFEHGQKIVLQSHESFRGK
ncbi:MAG: glycosyltransferase family 2 protein [Candidatus Riflebacteria bacterium]|nr:glycosyltransferase family 2 protein [Candidatus Riflebacteria bacterium]